MEFKVTSFEFYSLDFQCCFCGCFYYSTYCCILLLSFLKVACYGHSQGTYQLNIFLLLWYIFSKHIEFALWRKSLSTLLMLLGSMHIVGLICMLVMGFLRCTLNSYLSSMELVMLMSKKFKDLFSFSYSMVYWIAVSYLFKISWKVLARCFDVKLAWLWFTYRLNVFGCICTVRNLAMALCSRCCK